MIFNNFANKGGLKSWKLSFGLSIILSLSIFFFIGCDTKDKTKDENCVTEDFFSEEGSRSFKMGFTTWSFGPELSDVNETYEFINDHADIYVEHIDDKIPWSSWIDKTTLPEAFTREIEGKVARRIEEKDLLISIGLLNNERSDLAEDYDGTIPNYTRLSDEAIADAYVEHVSYLINAFLPKYLVIVIESNELKIQSSNKWDDYKTLINNVTSRIKTKFPELLLSESTTLHNLYKPEVVNPDAYIHEMVERMNKMDFVSISFYPFFKGLHTRADFQKAFDFLHKNIHKPIAFVETNHLAEDLEVLSFDLFIEGDPCEQNIYLETLLLNAQQNNYEFVIWWAHRDFDALWETFPENVKDLGKIWRDTGLLDEEGNERISFETWMACYGY